MSTTTSLKGFFTFESTLKRAKGIPVKRLLQKTRWEIMVSILFM